MNLHLFFLPGKDDIRTILEPGIVIQQEKDRYFFSACPTLFWDDLGELRGEIIFTHGFRFAIR